MAQSQPRRTALSRREALRRGALAGGSLLWAAPVIQSVRTPAFAASGFEGCCQCNKAQPFPGVLNGLTCTDCAEACVEYGGVRVYTRGDRCESDAQACVPTSACPQQPCAWESNGPQKLKKLKP